VIRIPILFKATLYVLASLDVVLARRYQIGTVAFHSGIGSEGSFNAQAYLAAHLTRTLSVTLFSARWLVHHTLREVRYGHTQSRKLRLTCYAEPYGPECPLVNVAAQHTLDWVPIVPIGARGLGRNLADYRPADRAGLLPRVFELFTQSERTLDRAQGGLGIGLSIVKQLIEMHGGECVARSPGIGQGSTFEITLPRSEPVAAAATDPPEAKRTRRRILIIDDNVDAATTLAEILRIEGHDCDAVFSANAALERAVGLRPDFILLDIGLPDLDGYEVARRLRQTEGLEDVGLIALTGYGQAEDLERARLAGFDGHFVKPLDFRQLERTLAQGLSGRRRI
jgi:CheY-like chemotaxis protein